MDAAVRLAAQELFLQYEARIPAKCMASPPPAALLGAQTALADALFSPAALAERPRSDAYDRQFVRALVARVEAAIAAGTDDDAAQLGTEKEDWAVDDTLMERHIAVLCTPDDRARGSILGASVPRPLVRTHYFPTRLATAADEHHALLGPCSAIRLCEEGSPISQGTTGLHTWEASLRLGNAVLENCADWLRPGERILELGSGAGFLGVLLAKMRARVPDTSLMLTDLDGSVLTRLRETAARSTCAVSVPTTDGVDDAVSIEPLDWTELECSASARVLQRAQATRVFAADVVYDPQLVPPLVRTIAAALRAGEYSAPQRPRSAVVASTVRNPATQAHFSATLAAHGLRARTVPYTQQTWPDTGAPLFPSAHSDDVDGRVEIVEVFLAGK
ncbi:hypothetical protein MSPP1_004059 [Malassezia sp. CBS 17886]|nr:hypothetical protein MSPP1_004059 [Malassezia sp. CBS 17886]